MDAIQPVITRVKVDNMDFDLEQVKVNLEQQFEQVHRNQMTSQERVNAEQFADEDEDLDQIAMNNDDKVAEDKLNQELVEFYKKFAEKIIAFDPMNRPIPDEEMDDMTKRDELVKILEVDMLPKAISGKLLQAPIMNEPY